MKSNTSTLGVNSLQGLHLAKGHNWVQAHTLQVTWNPNQQSGGSMGTGIVSQRSPPCKELIRLCPLLVAADRN